MILAGRNLLVTGVLTSHSIGWHVARRAQQQGANVVLTGFGRTRRMTERAARQLPTVPPVIELDVDRPEDLEQLAAEVRRHVEVLHGAVHAIAYAPPDVLGGGFSAGDKASATAAFRLSAWSLAGMTHALRPMLAAEGAAIVGLDFDASVAWPTYDWMGVAKAALESVSRYLARELGPAGIRVNLVSAGPLATPAAAGIPAFGQMAAAWARESPLRWDVDDPEPVADIVCVLLSDLARAVTGEIVHVDGGLHAVRFGGALIRADTDFDTPTSELP
jgi:enoyl-[acyl-carrier protein] reductase I